jgi:cellulose synthase/poly-beta-1,6-N-acetylglucosamine synthase-like glycosyltransferase
MHLIEDRMLTMEMLTNSDDLVTVNYVHDAEFETDVPLDFNTFLK